jgi:hypothetical protein
MVGGQLFYRRRLTMLTAAELDLIPVSAFNVAMSAIARGEPVVRACAEAGISRTLFYAAVTKHREIAAQYADAVKSQITARFAK